VLPWFLPIVLVAVLSAAMLPWRHHLASATSALVLVIPVVAGVAVGGIGPGLVAVAAGLLAYDLIFIEPYSSLSIASAQHWVAVAVYVVVMVVVARIVSRLREARADAKRGEEHSRTLLQLSEELIGDSPLVDLLDVIVTTVQRAFALRSAAVLLPAGTTAGWHTETAGGALEIAALAGATLSEAELARVSPAVGAGAARSLFSAVPGNDEVTSLSLTADGRPVGLLVVAGVIPAPDERELLQIYANHAALAIERSRLREQAVLGRVAEEGDLWRQALLGAVSHDLRTPLATIKAALSDLRDDELELPDGAHAELLELAENQADRLDRLVANLLDMTQIRAGAIQLRRSSERVEDLVADAIAALGPSWGPRLATSFPLTLPSVNVDRVLAVQALANLLDNAARHAPHEAPVLVRALPAGCFVEIAVEDRGPGVAPEDRERIFGMFSRIQGAGRAGLGLAIVKAFVEANGGRVGVRDRAGGGASFTICLPTIEVARASDEPERRGERPPAGERKQHARGNVGLTDR